MIAVGVLALGVVMVVDRGSASDDEPAAFSIVSPLVALRSTLTNRADVEMFRVNADSPAYWRITTLPEYDGVTFRLPTRQLERMESDVEAGVGGTIRQQVQILSIGGQLVPAAAEPKQAEGVSGGGEPIALRLNRDTSTLVSPDDLEAGDVFTIVSATVMSSPAQLRVSASSSPPDPIHVALPDDLPVAVLQLAAEVTVDATSSYDAAIALQNWFRASFDLSFEVQSGHGTRALEEFLAERVGYAEQFAAAFAVMARTLGIPSRVAVGFTPGVLSEDGWYSVLGGHAHAWPEIWFDGIGWMPFEPTPTDPGAESYVVVAAEQAAS